jgi:hypothetical protein
MTIAVGFLTMSTRAFSAADIAESPSASAATSEPSAISAAERAVEAAQRIAVERMELMRLELVDAADRMLLRAGLSLAAGFVTILGWLGLAIALVVVLADRMPLAASIALVAGTHVLLGIVLGFFAAAITKRKTT